uniref:RHS repeat domain-containing protein n=1 Tax=Cellvibrio fontiphilus TaxID=1815559 RepID=UPI002B4BAD98|nr:RHS repeat-associated core domain-containing protein [Cellvibrio fontiphilus]
MDNTTTSYVHTDHLGSVVAESNSAGQITKRFHYKPFGETLETQQDDIGYTGHKHDADLGLTYMQARYYDPVLGRFYGNDPVGFRDVHSFNRFAYANNNPYKYNDPTGETPLLLLLLGGGGTATTTTATATVAGVGLTEVVVGAVVVGTAVNAADVLQQPEPGTKESDKGCIYLCDGVSEGQTTPSGNPYVGSADDKEQRAKTAKDGRDRSKAKTIGEYLKGDRDGRRKAEQKGINENGGKNKLDNMRDEVKESKWKEKEIEPPKESQ